MRELERLLSRYTEETYGFLRIIAGLLFACHGLQILFGFWTDPSTIPAVGSELWFGGLIELVTGSMLAAGFWTSFAGFLASGQMAVAYFQFHWKLSFSANFFPIVNHGEMAALYCFLFLFIASKGGGKWSMDSSIWGRR